MVFKPPLEHNMGMSRKNVDGLELPFLHDEESIRLQRDKNLFKRAKKKKNIF